MDAGNTYMVRNKLESDAGDAVDVTGMVASLETVGITLPQAARNTPSRIKAMKRHIVLNFIFHLQSIQH
jgi:hypothetical protein